MGKYQLIYFAIRGRGEPIRLLLHDNGLEFEDLSCSPWEKWVNEFRPQMTFGQCPGFKDDDFLICQSNAILRHLARKHGLYGANDQEACLIDMINDAVEDIRVEYTKMIYMNYENGKDKFVASLPPRLEFIENFVAKHGNAKSGFSVGNQSSFTDYNIADFLECLVTLSPSCLDKFPALDSLMKANFARPNIAKYRQTELFKSRTINNNGKQ